MVERRRSAALPVPADRLREPIDALAMAGAQHPRGHSGAATAPRRRRVLLPVSIALFLGGSVSLIGRLQYPCEAVFHFAESASAAEHLRIRRELLDFLWRASDIATAEGRAPESWSVDTPATDSLRFTTLVTDRPLGVERLQRLATAFMQRLTEEANEFKTSPTPAEKVLTSHLDELRTALMDARSRVDSATEAIPAENPIDQRHALASRWRIVREGFAETRSQLAGAATHLSVLRTTPDPTHGLVTDEERREAMEADDSLQNDLRELTVNLVELRAQLITIDDRTQPELSALQSAAADWIHTIGTDTTALDSQTRAVLDRLKGDAAAYREHLTRLAHGWAAHFAAIRQNDLDATSNVVLNSLREVEGHLNDFLFTSAAQLSSMRSQLNTLAAQPSIQARPPMWHSECARAFHVLQNAHHRFEFAAGRINGTDDFRIDAARRAAFGLRRRTQERIRIIEERLQTRAAEQAKQSRRQETLDQEQLVDRVRSITDQTVDQLLTLQEELNSTAERSEEFHVAQGDLNRATERLDITQAMLAETQRRLDDLETTRLATEVVPPIRLVSCEALDRPVNLLPKAITGLVVFMLAFGALMLGQSWTATRP